MLTVCDIVEFSVEAHTNEKEIKIKILSQEEDSDVKDNSHKIKQKILTKYL